MFHKRVAIDIGNREFVVLQIEIDKEAKEFASCQARHKALHTSNADQSGLNRGQLLKDSKQYSGCLSEMAVEYFLELIVSEERRLHDSFARVVRYDDVRQDGYERAEGEYDIRVLLSRRNCHIDFSVRSSLGIKGDIRNAINHLNIIGPYTNLVKTKEDWCDFYIQPIFQLKVPEPSLTAANIDFELYFERGLLDLYIVGGCPRAMMENSTKRSHLGQKDTKYRILGIKDGMDCVELSRAIRGAIRAMDKKIQNNEERKLAIQSVHSAYQDLKPTEKPGIIVPEYFSQQAGKRLSEIPAEALESVKEEASRLHQHDLAVAIQEEFGRRNTPLSVTFR